MNIKRIANCGSLLFEADLLQVTIGRRTAPQHTQPEPAMEGPLPSVSDMKEAPLLSSPFGESCRVILLAESAGIARICSR